MLTAHVPTGLKKNPVQLYVSIPASLSLVFTSYASTSAGVSSLCCENERRRKHPNQPWRPPFCSNAQTRGILNECFNWPDVAHFAYFHTTQANASISAKHKEKEKFWFLRLCVHLRLCLRQPRFHGEIRALLMLASCACVASKNQAYLFFFEIKKMKYLLSKSISKCRFA